MNELGPQRRQTKKCGTNVRDENDYLFHYACGIFLFLDVGKSIIRNQCIITEYIECKSQLFKRVFRSITTGSQ